MKAKRIIVVGCGGVGGIFAASLIRAGFNVTVVTNNQEITDAIKQNGYRVQEFQSEDWQVPSSNPPQVSLENYQGPSFDLCILATKLTTMKEALQNVKPFLQKKSNVICCQNGLPEDIAAREIGKDRVIGCVVGFGATMNQAGVYERTSRGSLQIGQANQQNHSLKPIEEILQAVAPTRISENLEGVRWSKLAINCATSTIGAIGGERLGPLIRRRFVRRLVLEIWTEIVAIAKKSKIQMARVAGVIDIQKMALTPSEQQTSLGSPALALKHSVLLAVAVKYRRMRSSMLVALERNRTPEIDFLNGEIVQRGKELGVSTPVNELLTQLVHQIIKKDSTSSVSLLHKAYKRFMQEKTQKAA